MSDGATIAGGRWAPLVAAGGLAYALFAASKLLGEDVDQWHELARRYVVSVRDPVTEDDLLDVSAGAVAPLPSWPRCSRVEFRSTRSA